MELLIGKKLLGEYKNGNYTVQIYEDGTKIRYTDDDEFVPAFAENSDCKITDKCETGCSFCYEGCTKDGLHGNIMNKKFLDSLHPYTELAINGNDMNHPELRKFLLALRRKKVFANITVNQKQFMENFAMLKKLQKEKLVYGIGVSLVGVTDELIENVKKLKNVVIHTINGILSKDDIEKMKDKGLKILILGYKDLNRGISYRESHSEEVTANQMYLYTVLPEMQKWFNVVSFDNLAIEQLNVKRIMSKEQWEQFYMGDDGHFTFYIDLVKGEFAKDSLSTERYPIGDKTVDEMFQYILRKRKEKIEKQ